MSAETSRTSQGRGKRLLWFVLLYAASLAAFTALVYGLRWVVPH